MDLRRRVEDLSDQQRHDLAHRLAALSDHGEEDGSAPDRLVVYFTTRDGQSLPATDLRSFLQQRLPDYMIPSDMVKLEQLPRLPNGKVDRRQLHWAPVQSESSQAPRTRIEQVIASIWADVLGRTEIGIHDDFFELGGHSLLSLRAAGELQQQLGREVPIAAIYDNPTVAMLASALSYRADRDVGTCLVPIRKEGTRAPIFVFHCGKGSVLRYYDLARVCDPGQPVYGVIPHGIDGLGKIDGSIEEMATRYAAEIVRIEPSGPYRLCGFSSGGLVAYETARQLRALGKPIAVLAMLDTVLLAAPDVSTRMANHLDVAKKLGPVGTMKLALQKTVGNARTLTRRAWEGGRDLPVWLKCKAIILRGKRLPEKLQPLHFYRYYARATYAYHPKSYDGPATLFRQTESNWFTGGKHDYGWQELAPDLDVEVVEGGHGGALRPKFVKRLAEKLQE